MRLNSKKMIDDRGITLVELIVCIAIMGVLVLLVTGYMNSGTKNYKRGTTQAAIERDIQVITDHIAEKIQESSKVIEIIDLRDLSEDTSVVNSAFLLKKSDLEGTLIVYNQSEKRLLHRAITYTSSELGGVALEVKVNDDYDKTKMSELSSMVLSFDITGSGKLYNIKIELGDDTVKTNRAQQVRLRNG